MPVPLPVSGSTSWYDWAAQVDSEARNAAPAGHTHPVGDLTATGARDATTFLRGDNTWASPGATSVADQRSIGIYRPENYGAVGNGSTDDTLAFQAMLDAVPLTGGTVMLQATVYAIPNGGLTRSAPVRIVGAGGLYAGNGSRLLVTGTAATALTLSGRSTVLEDFAVEGPIGSSLSTNSVGVSITGDMPQAHNLSIYGFSTALRIAASYYVLDSCTLRAWQRIGIEVYSIGGHGDNGDATITGCTIDRAGASNVAGGTGVSWTGGGGLRFINNKVIGDGDYQLLNGLLYTPATGVATGVLLIEGNSIEQFTGSGIGVVNGAGGIYNSLIIIGNELAAYERTASTCISLDESTSGVVVSGNHCYYATNGIDIAHMNSVAVTGNTLTQMTNVGIRVRSTASSVMVDPNQPILMDSGTPLQFDDPDEAAIQDQTYTPLEKSQVQRLTSTVVVPYASTLTVDASQGHLFRITLTGDMGLEGPLNPIDGQEIVFELIQDATGGRDLFPDTGVFKLGSTVTSWTLSTAANARDFLRCIYNATSGKWYVVAVAKGY